MERKLLDTARRILIAAAFAPLLAAQVARIPSTAPARSGAPTPDAQTAQQEAAKRIELNVLGRTDTASGESRRNENIQFNLVDNNALKELNLRLGTSATIIEEFRPERNYFGAEFGNPPSAVIHAQPLKPGRFHGRMHWSHLNSATSARSFFQVGSVKPARENDYGLSLGGPLSRRWLFQADASQQKLRGNVNGNVLAPTANERTPLATDATVRALITRFLAAYPLEQPNRTDINARALNTNAPQVIDNNNAALSLTRMANRDRVVLSYSFFSQSVDAFQLVAGQNPDTDTKNHRARITWNRNWSARTTSDFTIGFDRIGSLLLPEPNAVGTTVSIAGLTTLGPLGAIPIDRAQNLFRYGGQVRHVSGNHNAVAGFGLLRRQFNGIETDVNRGFLSFANDFGRDAITNLRLGLPNQYIVSLGDVHRGFRNWDMQYYAGDSWRASGNLQVQLGVRYTPVTRPSEVNNLNAIAYDCDCNNVAPQFGLAWKPGRNLGVVRAAYGLHYGEIFPVTFQQVRFTPPRNRKVVVTAPDILNPLESTTPAGDRPRSLANLYLLDPELSTPYSHQYNFSWEPNTPGAWRIQFGYVGSRSHRLLLMWYLNRAHPVEGIPQITATINDRRPDPNYAEKRLVVNGSRGYFDAARVTLIVPRWKSLSIDASYWYSKAMDLGSSYTNTAYEADSRVSRSQSEFEQQRDMKALSSFDQPHAFLVRASYQLWAWTFSSVTLLKSGTPFTVLGADGPGYGNVDGNGGDRPNLVDVGVLGRTIGNPDTSQQLLPRSAFSFPQPSDEFGGNLGRSTFRKGGIYNVNASVGREFTVAGDRKLGLRVEAVNLLNTPQFAEPGVELTNPNFGAITNTLNDGRTFRASMRFSW
ncbi:MAG: TonB-dependent receptor [Bryobacteraceae bacterium]